MPDADQLVSAPPRRCEVFHTDPDCHHLTREDRDARPVSDAAREWHELELCPDCSDEEHRETGPKPELVRQRVSDD